MAWASDHRRLADLGFGALLLLFLVAAAISLERYGEGEQEAARATQLQLARLDARHVDDQFSQTLNLVDIALEGLLESGYSSYAVSDWNYALASSLRHSPHLRSLSLLNADGVVIASSSPRNIGLTPRFQPFFPADRSHGVLMLGSPWSGRDFDSGEPLLAFVEMPPRIGFLPVMRTLSKGEAGPLTLVATLNLDFFLNQFAQRLSGQESWVDVLRYDGALLFSSERAGEGRNDAAANAELTQRWQAGEEHATRVETLADGRRALTAWRLSRRYPFAVVTRIDERQALADTHARQQDRQLLFLPVLVLALILAGLGYLTLRRHAAQRLAHEELARKQLSGLLDSLPAAALMFNADGHIVLANRAWLEVVDFHALPAAQVLLGATYRDLSDSFAVREGSDMSLAEGIHAVLMRDLRLFEGEFRLVTSRGARWFQVIVQPEEGTRGDGAVLLALDITRRHDADARLRLASCVFTASADAIVITDADNRIVSVNPAFTRITGYAEGEVLGQNPRVLGSGEQSRSFYASLWASLRERGFWQGEIINRRKDGTAYTEWLTISVDRDGAGNVLHHVGIFSDISAVKRTESELRLTDQRYRRTLAAVQDGMWSWELDSGLMHWDAVCYQMLGYHPDSFPLSRAALLDLMHPEDRGITWPALEAGLGEDGMLRAELRLRGADGQWSWVKLRGRVVERSEGKAELAVGTLTDINERKAAELRLRLLDAAVGAAPVAIMVTDTQAVIQSVNPAFQSLTGFPPQDAIGRRPSDLVKSGMQPKAFYEALWNTILSGTVWRGELINRHREGHFYHEELTIAPVRDELGTLRNFVAIKQDISARKEAEAALLATRGRLAAVIANFQGAVMVEDEWRNIVLVNQTFCDTFGFRCPADELLNRPWSEVMREHDLGISNPERFFQRLDEVLAQREPVLGEEMGMRDGRVLERDYIPILEGRTFLGHLRVYRDITERKERERELRRLATTDPLTGVYNRRHFMDVVQQELARHLRYGKPAALLMLDLDHFKAVNDTYGHAAGDAVLRHFAEMARLLLRRTDAIGRLGGEEFAILLPHTDEPGALELAERLRRYVADHLVAAEEFSIAYTVSIGVATFAQDGSPDSILARADRALYNAKSGGRNQVAVLAAAS